VGALRLALCEHLAGLGVDVEEGAHGLPSRAVLSALRILRRAILSDAA
jgi:hypothetical protein